MSKYKNIKTLVFSALGILILIFNNYLIDKANILVGSLMILFGVEGVVIKFVKGKIKEELSKFFNDVLIIILGIILFFLGKEEQLVTLCVVWATWAILREGWEISEVFQTYKVKTIAVINIIESVIVVIISILFIFSPTLEKLHTHIIILGIELILEVMFPLSEFLILKKLHKE